MGNNFGRLGFFFRNSCFEVKWEVLKSVAIVIKICLKPKGEELICKNTVFFFTYRFSFLACIKAFVFINSGFNHRYGMKYFF